MDRVKQKRKNLEKRREKSRHAARHRRGKESDIFTEISDILPVVEEQTVTHIDRIAVLRLAVALCRARALGPYLVPSTEEEDEREKKAEDSLPSELGEGGLWTEESLGGCLPGFLFVLDGENNIIYISQGVSVTLGLTQTDLIGQNMEDFIHTEDLEEINKSGDDELGEPRPIILRLKSVLTPRGRNLNLKSATYKTIGFTINEVETEGMRVKLLFGEPLLAVVTSAQQQAQESNLNPDIFMTRHSCDMKFTYCHEKATKHLGYDPKSLMGTSFFALVHPQDLKDLSISLKTLLAKGQCRSNYYRLLGRNGDMVWVQTEATAVSHSTRGQRGQYIVCSHTVIGMFAGPDSASAESEEGTLFHPGRVRRNRGRRNGAARTGSQDPRPGGLASPLGYGSRQRPLSASRTGDNPTKKRWAFEQDPEIIESKQPASPEDSKEEHLRLDSVPSPGTICRWLLDDFDPAAGLDPLTLQLAGLSPPSSPHLSNTPSPLSLPLSSDGSGNGARGLCPDGASAPPAPYPPGNVAAERSSRLRPGLPPPLLSPSPKPSQSQSMASCRFSSPVQERKCAAGGQRDQAGFAEPRGGTGVEHGGEGEETLALFPRPGQTPTQVLPCLQPTHFPGKQMCADGSGGRDGVNLQPPLPPAHPPSPTPLLPSPSSLLSSPLSHPSPSTPNWDSTIPSNPTPSPRGDVVPAGGTKSADIREWQIKSEPFISFPQSPLQPPTLSPQQNDGERGSSMTMMSGEDLELGGGVVGEDEFLAPFVPNDRVMLDGFDNFCDIPLSFDDTSKVRGCNDTSHQFRTIAESAQKYLRDNPVACLLHF